MNMGWIQIAFNTRHSYTHAYSMQWKRGQCDLVLVHLFELSSFRVCQQFCVIWLWVRCISVQMMHTQFFFLISLNANVWNECNFCTYSFFTFFVYMSFFVVCNIVFCINVRWNDDACLVLVANDKRNVFLDSFRILFLVFIFLFFIAYHINEYTKMLTFKMELQPHFE